MPDSEPEPLAAILAEFRKFALRAAEEDKMISPESVLLLADKAEAAVKREREAAQGARDMRDALEYAFAQKSPKFEQPGNAAAMREALESIIENLAIHIKCGRFSAPGDHVSFPIIEAEAYIRDARAALAAPARNCDVGTAEEQAERFEAECNRHDHCTPCPVHREWGEFKEGKPKSCQMIWAQMPFAPAKENGGNKQ